MPNNRWEEIVGVETTEYAFERLNSKSMGENDVWLAQDQIRLRRGQYLVGWLLSDSSPKKRDCVFFLRITDNDW